MVLAARLSGSDHYSAETKLGMLVALSLLRELGPVVAALLFAGRAGSALTAEIGLMRALQSNSSMEMMAVIRCVGLFLPVSGLELFHYHC